MTILENVYPAGDGKATTTLTAAFTAGTSSTITVGDASKLMAAPNIVTIMDPDLLGEKYVVVTYTNLTGNVLSGLTVKNGVPGTTQAFSVGAIVSREITGAEWEAIRSHIANTENPHGVSIEQIGAAATTHAATHKGGGADAIPEVGEVAGLMSSEDKHRLEGMATGAQVNVLEGIQVDGADLTITSKKVNLPLATHILDGVMSSEDKTALDTHQISVANPHAVTKAQVGLGSCDNTSDANKPISTAQQTALNDKAALTHASRHEDGGADAVSIDTSQIITGRLTIARLTQNILPSPSFTWARDPADIQNTIVFIDTSTTISGTTITSRRWNFGDGYTSTSQNPRHTYPAFGRYNVTLAVTNDHGQTAVVNTITVAADPIYGIRIIDAETSPSAKVVYINDAIGMTPVYYDTETGAWNMGSWGSLIDEVFDPLVLPYAAAAPRYLDKTDLAKYTVDGTPSPCDLISGNPADGDLMVGISKLIYLQVAKDGNDILINLCESMPDQTFNPIAHRHGDVIESMVYMGMFKGIVESGVLKSKYSLTAYPTASTKQDTYRSYTTAAKKGSDTYGLRNENTTTLYYALSCLFLRNTNFQGNVGNGNSTNEAYLHTGDGYDLTGGPIQGDTIATNTAVVLFWVANPWGDYWEDIDGVVKIADGTYWANRTNTNFLNIEALPETCPDNYEVVRCPTPASGYALRMSGDSRLPWMPTATGSPADSTHGFCDYFYKDVGVRKLIRGGYRSSGAGCGPFGAGVSYAPGSSNGGIVARLQAFPAAE